MLKGVGFGTRTVDLMSLFQVYSHLILRLEWFERLSLI